MNQKAGRNDPCPCGSGKKYKGCCWKSHQPSGKKMFTAKLLNNTAAQISKAFTHSLQSEKNTQSSGS